MNEDPFDREFDAAFEKAVQNREWLPDSDASWKKVESKLNRRRKRRNRLKALPYVAASFLLGAVIFGSPAVTKAFSPLYQSLINLQQGVVHAVFGSGEEQEDPTASPKTATPPAGQSDSSVKPGEDIGGDETVQKEFPTWEEAASSVPFPKPLNPHMPEGYKLDRVLVIHPHGTGSATTAVLLYAGPGGETVTVTFRQLEEGEKVSSDYREIDGKLETVRIGGNEAYLFSTKDGANSLEMLTRGLYVSFVGNVGKETIVRMAGGAE